jgi:hypothetical protein
MDDFEGICKKSSCGLIKILIWHLLGGSEENHGKPVTIAAVSAEIQTVHLLNESRA